MPYKIDFLIRKAGSRGVETIGEISQRLSKIVEAIENLIVSAPIVFSRNEIDAASRRDDIFDLCPGKRTFPPDFVRIRA